MNKQIELIEEEEEEEEPVEVTLLRNVNSGALRIEQLNCEGILNGLLQTIRRMKQPVSYIGGMWALLNVLDDFILRNEILEKWRHLATVCLPSKKAADDFVVDTECLMQINNRLHDLLLRQGAQLPQIYDNKDVGKGLNELALLWYENLIDAKNLVELASEIHTSVHSGCKPPVVDYFLRCSRWNNRLKFGNICDFSKGIFTAESYRQYLVEGKMYTPAAITFGDFNRKLRNACFEEYIRLRIEQIKKEKNEDNWQLLDPTEEDCYRQLCEEEKCVADREFGLEQFRGSIAYKQQWYKGRHEVLNMIKYFINYLDKKMTDLQNVRTINNTQIIQGDLVAGNKIMGDMITDVKAGGIGKQVICGAQPADMNTAANEPVTKPENEAEPKSESKSKTKSETESQKPAQQKEYQGELFKYIHYSVTDNEERLYIHKQICNIVRYPQMSTICSTLKDLQNDKKILSTTDPSAMLKELRRLGLPSDQKGFSDQNFFSHYKKS